MRSGSNNFNYSPENNWPNWRI